MTSRLVDLVEHKIVAGNGAPADVVVRQSDHEADYWEQVQQPAVFVAGGGSPCQPMEEQRGAEPRHEPDEANSDEYIDEPPDLSPHNPTRYPTARVIQALDPCKE